MIGQSNADSTKRLHPQEPALSVPTCSAGFRLTTVPQESNAPNALEVPMQAVGEQSSIAGPVMGDLQQSLQMPSYSQLLKQREDCGLETLRCALNCDKYK